VKNSAVPTESAKSEMPSFQITLSGIESLVTSFWAIGTAGKKSLGERIPANPSVDHRYGFWRGFRPCLAARLFADRRFAVDCAHPDPPLERAGELVCECSVFPRSAASRVLDGRDKTELDLDVCVGRADLWRGSGSVSPGTGGGQRGKRLHCGQID